MHTPHPWLLACDAVVTEWLAAAGCTSPAVDILELGARQQMTLVWDAEQAGRGRLLRRAGQTTILLKPDERPERIQWAAAHEVGESLVWQVCRQASVDGEDVTPRQREELANALAQRLLLPAEWFLPALETCDGDLHRLKAIFETSSYELIAMRRLDFFPNSCVTVWDRGQLTRRKSVHPQTPRRPTADELAIWERVHAGEPAAELYGATGRVRGWAIHEPDWKREITCWEIPEPSEDHSDW